MIDPARSSPETAPPALPARLHTLAALRLPALVGAAAAVDASRVEEIGFAALQWLAARGIAVVSPSPTFADAARDGGFAAALLGEAMADDGGRAIVVRFADAALDFGREPVIALAALARAGATMTARPRGVADPAPDAIAFDIVACLPDGLDDEAVAAALGAFEGAYTLASTDADCDAPPRPAAPVPADAAAPAGVRVAEAKLTRLMTLADELASAQEMLAQALGGHRVAVTAEIGEVDRLWRILQSAIADLGAAPAADLLGLPADGWRWDGPPLEVERAVIDHVRGPLRALLAESAGGIVSGTPDGSLARLAFAPALPPAPALATAVEGIGGRIAREGDALTMRLPRSLSLVDALVLEVGDGCYALPVARMVEALRPEPAMLHHLGPGRALLRFDGGYLPVVAVGGAFDVAGWQGDPTQAVLVVAETARGRVALLIDAIVDQQQVTVKPVDGGIGRPRGTLGAAIVRGNRVALVIDVDALAG